MFHLHFHIYEANKKMFSFYVVTHMCISMWVTNGIKKYPVASAGRKHEFNKIEFCENIFPSIFLSESDLLFKSNLMFHTYIIPYNQGRYFSQNKLRTMSILSHFLSVALGYFHFSWLKFSPPNCKEFT